MSENNDNYFEVYGQEGGQDSNDLIKQENGGTDSNQEQNGDTTQQIDSTGGAETMNEESDLFEIQKRVKVMDEEAARLVQLQSEMEQQMKSINSPTASAFTGPPAPMSYEEKLEADLRSIYVGNVDYSATAQELEAHFHGCGSINRVTILCDRFSGHPKGFAYVEFGDKDSVQTAMALDDSLFKGRQIKVVCKRTNRPGISSTDRLPRGGGRGAAQAASIAMMPSFFGPGGFGMGGRGRGRGGMGGYGAPRGGGGGFGGGPYGHSFRGKVSKGRGFYHFSPY